MEGMRTHRIPGATLGILAGDREEHAAFGVASTNTLAPVTDDTLFQIGSLSKTHIATVIWRLIEQGSIDPEAPVRTYVPDLRVADEDVAATVTTNHLLNHSAGWWGDEGTYTGEDDQALVRYVTDRMPQFTQLFPLGTQFSYNNAGFSLMGRIIETVTGTPFRAAMDDLLFGPLELPNTVIDPSSVLQHPYSEGHYVGSVNGTDRVLVQAPLWLPRSAEPAGGVWSTTRDVLRYARLHFGDSPDLLSAETIRAMQEPSMDIPGIPLQMARNWFVQDVDGMRVIIHNGDTTAQHTVFFAIPEQRFAMILVVNSHTGASATEMATIDAALGSYPGLAGLTGQVGLARAGTAPQEPAATLSAAELGDYTGRFEDLSLINTFALNGTELTRQSETITSPEVWQPAIGPEPSDDPVPVTFAARDLAIARGTRLPFVRDDTGTVRWVNVGFRLVLRATD